MDQQKKGKQNNPLVLVSWLDKIAWAWRKFLVQRSTRSKQNYFLCPSAILRISEYGLLPPPSKNISSLVVDFSSLGTQHPFRPIENQNLIMKIFRGILINFETDSLYSYFPSIIEN